MCDITPEKIPSIHKKSKGGRYDLQNLMAVEILNDSRSSLTS